MDLERSSFAMPLAQTWYAQALFKAMDSILGRSSHTLTFALKNGMNPISRG
jgi:hypothetical protein